MGRRLYLRHLEEATASSSAGVSNVHSPDEGVVAFEFSYTQNLNPKACSIRLLAVDVDEYPDGNNYMLFTEDDHIDPAIPKAFEIITPVLNGVSISEAIAEISRALTDSLTSGLAANPIELDAEAEEDESDFDDGFLDGEDSDNDNFGLNEISSGPAATRIATSKRQRTSLSPSVKIDKVKSDLRAAKNAGFRIGIIGDLVSGGVVTISIRVTKLGLSEEAMHAWGLKRSHYLILLIRFREGYRGLQQVKEDATLNDRTEMRVALCQAYKPSDHDAYDAFDQTAQPKVSTKNSAPLEPLFIGSPLNDLFRERFARIVNFRESCGFNWRSAEAFVNDVQGKALTQDEVEFDNYVLSDESGDRALPSIVTADALDGKLLKDTSLPLVAMQFLLRHFVRCTEFCLVCHCRVDDTFEALKPYVCSKPLCLYQYMALGFGPSIEWEVLSQPYVVDLLISFCYAAAKQGRLKEFPVGIDLKVPMLPHYNCQLAYYRAHYGANGPTNDKEKKSKDIQRTFNARIDFSKNEMIFQPRQKTEVAPFRRGDWFMVRNIDGEYDYHYRVEEVMFPTWRLGDPVTSKVDATNQQPRSYYNEPTPTSSRPATPPKVPRTGIVPVDCFAYNESFDSMTKDQQSHAIITLLDTLPSVMDMKEYLERVQTGKEPALKSWRSRIPDSALNLLRWIIASNRSCIMQVDRLVEEVADGKSTLLNAADARVSGMDNWMQFRFAQGAPDKEQRFVDAVSQESQAAGKQHPTLFAWHGSPVSNWHSIIRQGLRFDETLHGRAYGHGVYMSNQASTSVGYAHMSYNAGGNSGTMWPASCLKISNAFSLQEVVNKPESFVSKSPHYVVANIDWIQTRYLFVKSELKHTVGEHPAVEYQQDPQVLCYNESSNPIHIPITAVSKSRRPAMSPTVVKNDAGTKKIKQSTATNQETAEQQEDDANSVISEDGDREFLESDTEDDDIMSIDGDEFYETVQASTPASPSQNRKRGLDTSNTDFIPGQLDVSNIKFLDPPKDASMMATKALQKALQLALKVQDSTSLAKLGWYINPDHVSNMYQWVVELHSFDAKLPLAKDMKKAGVSSIVLEMRFTNQYPFSPPFIRVIKPRFLPFQSGGGGHVTDGGAICMELLTNAGWSAVTSIEMVLLQVRLAMSDEERPAKLLSGDCRFGGHRGDSYGVGEAVTAYERACRAHGWQVPEGFGKFAQEEFSKAEQA